jgi:hypothetical protein
MSGVSPEAIISAIVGTFNKLLIVFCINIFIIFLVTLRRFIKRLFIIASINKRDESRFYEQ